MKEKSGNHYSITSILNHWVIGGIFLAMMIFGFYLAYADIPRADKGALMFWHKSIGATFIVLALWRLGWRLSQGFPKDVAVMPKWQGVSARIMHWLLYIGLLIMPASGIVMNLFGGRDLNIFNIFAIPGLERNEVVSSGASFLHHNAPYAIMAIITLHVAAAFKHHFIDKDDTLKRMLKADNI